MKRLVVSLVAGLAAASLVLGGCSQAAPAAPTQAPAAPARAAEPAKPAESAKPAAKVDYPTKGKPILSIVPYAAGGDTDIIARMLADAMGKDLGTPVEVMNKAGAASQVGLTEAFAAKPDGYTLLWSSLPSNIAVYVDPSRKATFGRKDFQHIGNVIEGVNTLVVQSTSPYKTAKDLIDAAKANPGKLKVGTSGFLGVNHLGSVELERVAGITISKVHFDGSGPALTALLGGHVDLGLNSVSEVRAHAMSGTVRVLGILDKTVNAFLPGVPTLESQGYKVYVGNSIGLSAQAAVSRDIVNVLAASLKKAVESEDFKKKISDRGSVAKYLDPAQYSAFWDEKEAQLKPLIEVAMKEPQK